MASGIAHDLVNVLSVIDAGLQLAKLNAGVPDTLQRCIATARHGVDHGLRLAATLVAFAREQQTETRSENVNDLLKDFEVFLRHGAGRPVQLSMDLESNIPNCLIDPTQFQAAILNLVINARDAAPTGGEVIISTGKYVAPSASPNSPGNRTFVRVSVADNGQGIDEQRAARIFEPFFTTKGEQGTGLGLPQVCELMRQVKGQIRVTTSPGEGTRFDLFFPATDSIRSEGGNELAPVKPRCLEPTGGSVIRLVPE
jgi:signal transduction histidine kinase